MKKLFNNILVPVDPDNDNGIAVGEAIIMANQLQCSIHLLYLQQGHKMADEETFDLLKEQIRQRYQPLLAPSLSLLIGRHSGAPEKGIIEYHGRHEIDLVLLSRNQGTMWPLLRRRGSVNVDGLLRKTQCPVLTISRAVPVLKNIVMPVGERMPMRKLLFATYLARASRSTIHLVSPGNGLDHHTGKARESLYKSYRLLRENTDLPIECLTVPGENLAEIAWDYARKIKADLILVGSGKESLLSGFLNVLRSRVLQGLGARSLFQVSRIPVMTVM